MRRFIRYIFIGTLSLFPIAIVAILINVIKDLGVDVFFRLMDITNSYTKTFVLIAIILFFIAAIGYAIERYGRTAVMSLIDSIMERIPAIKTIYSVAIKVTNLFQGKDENAKKEVVLVEYPKEDVWILAYVINRHKDVLVLFAPTSPNPTSGYTVIVKKEKVIKVDISLEEASAFVISMGSDFIKAEEIESKISGYKALKVE